MIFEPVDHKDSSLNYREEVWTAVSEVLSSSLHSVQNADSLVGDWRLTYHSSKREVTYRFSQDKSLSIGIDGSESQVMFAVDKPGVVNVDGETYHCAFTTDGKLVIFNGDGSSIKTGGRADS